jgi:hypothetical protein
MRPRAALVREDGSLAWPGGVEVGAPSRALAPVTIVVDTKTSVVLVQRVPGKSGAPDRALATRYDARGRMLWDKPIDLGEARGGAKARIVATRAREGVVRVDLARAVEVDADGRITKGDAR